MRQGFDLAARQLLELLFPARCVECKEYGNMLCEKCFNVVDILPKDSSQHPHLDLLVACDYKQALVAKLVTSLKYDFIKDLDLVCAQIIFKFLIENHCLPDKGWVMTFVPMHQRKEILRGFNQSELIARHLGRMLDMAVFELLQKVRPTKAQATLDRQQRLTNLAGAFEARKCAGKKILLIDDVVTTGSTFLECANALKKAGAEQVRCLAFARD